jgi:glycosyltransferase involved in cell wall biosynthesis
MYYLISHVVYQKAVPIYGPIHVVAEYLKLKKQKFIQITAPLTFEGKYEYIDGRFAESEEITDAGTVGKYLKDIFYFFKKLFANPPGLKDTVIAADPLCAFPCIILKPFYSFTFIYYTVDYADKRFDNAIIEYLYRFLDSVALICADRNWCVSTRIVEIRRKQGYGTKAIFIPNTNITTSLPTTQNETKKSSLIYVGRMEKNMYVLELLAACKKMLAAKKKFSLTLIGGGNLAEDVSNYIEKYKLQKFVKYLGPLANSDVQAQLAQHGIGLGLYGDSKNWNRYGDSMKIREYQQFGLPVITTDVPSNAEEVAAHKAGVVLPFNAITETGIISAIQEIQNGYATFTRNSVIVAKNNLKVKILDRALNL